MPSSYNIGSHYEDLVRNLVESGRYASASEVVRDSLRLLEEREEQRPIGRNALRMAIQAGIDSGEAISADDVLDRPAVRYEGKGAT